MMRRGWCPSLYRPMESGDGLLLRVRVPYARLDVAAARALAQAARLWGSGIIQLTSRGNVQLRGFRPETVKPFADAMVEAGLASADPLREAARIVTVPPLCGEALRHLADAIEAALLPLAPRLPPKYGLCLDEVQAAYPIAAMPADIRLTWRDDAVMVALDGGSMAALVSVDAVPERTTALTSWLIAQTHGRMRAALAEYDSVEILRRAGMTELTSAPLAPPAWGAGYDKENGVLSLQPLFGQMDAETLERIAAMAAEEGDGLLYLSPFRCLLLAGITRMEALEQATDSGLGVIVSTGDRRSTLLACPGAPSCAATLARTQEDALRLFDALGRADIHVSGCAKGCAGRGPRSITLVGTMQGYDLIRDGGPLDKPVARGLSLRQVLAALQTKAEP
ncbi:Precorrin-3B synthase [Granulibacter bethesdensis]|nr:Precorrin-3B synthase [Granulibacter bethesdensis]